MRAVLLSIGTRGHREVIKLLANGLHDKGHEAIIVSSVGKIIHQNDYVAEFTRQMNDSYHGVKMAMDKDTIFVNLFDLGFCGHHSASLSLEHRAKKKQGHGIRYATALPAEWDQSGNECTGMIFDMSEGNPSKELSGIDNPVVIAFGSMIIDKDAMLKIACPIIANGNEVVIVGGWSERVLVDGARFVEEADYRWLFKRASCVVHHGGYGTTAACIAAKVPSVIVPFLNVQKRMGRSVHRFGFGRLTSGNVAQEVEEAKRINIPSFRNDGLFKAVEFIESVAASS